MSRPQYSQRVRSLPAAKSQYTCKYMAPSKLLKFHEAVMDEGSCEPSSTLGVGEHNVATMPCTSSATVSKAYQR
jgi:hypothetical protein